MSKIKSKYPTIYLISPDPKKIEGLECAWPNLKILSGKSSPYLRSVNKKGEALRSSAKTERRRGADITFLKLPKIKKTSELLSCSDVKKRLRKGSRILVFKNLPKIEKLAKSNSWKILMPDSKFINLLEDKINFVDFCTKNKLPLIPSKIIQLDKVNFSKPIVVQLRRGHAGESTFFIRSKSELEKLKKSAGEWTVKVMPLLKLPTFSLNLCVTKKSIYLTQPFYQITGDKKLNPLPGGTGGIDFDLAQTMLSEETRRQAFSLAEKIGKSLRKIGYQGIAGVDFLVDNEKQKNHLIELNPRLLSNLGFITKLQKKAGETPMLTIHLLEMLGEDVDKLNLPKISQVKSGRFELPHPNAKQVF